jgi:hypothetical protein
MPTSDRSDNHEQKAPRQDADKIVMRSVVSYDQLLGAIEERNPIVAQRQKRRD